MQQLVEAFRTDLTHYVLDNIYFRTMDPSEAMLEVVPLKQFRAETLGPALAQIYKDQNLEAIGDRTKTTLTDQVGGYRQQAMEALRAESIELFDGEITVMLTPSVANAIKKGLEDLAANPHGSKIVRL